MNRKIHISIVWALLAAILLSAFAVPGASAQTEQPDRDPAGLGRLRRVRVLGQVTAVTDQQLTLETRQGQPRTFRLDESTRYRGLDGAELSLADVKVGVWVGVVARPLARLRRIEPFARAVVILPAGLDPEQVRPVRGKIIAIDPSAGAFTVENRQGVQTTIAVNADTRFPGQATTLAGLQPSMAALSLVEEQPDGALLALSVRARLPLDRPEFEQGIVGKVTAVADGAFTVQSRDGKSYTFIATAATLFRSPAGRVQGLDDMQAGMAVLVGANGLDLDRPVAVVISVLRIGRNRR